MRRFFLFVTIVLFVAACNNGSDEKKTDNTVVTTAADSKPSYDSIQLTADEIKDDSLDDAGYPNGTTWEHAGINDSISFKKFVKQLKVWSANGAKENIATMLDYPLTNPEVKDEKDFIANYDKYFSEKVRKALESQKLSQIYRDRLGIRIKDGEIWLKQTGKGYKITAINN